MSIVTRFKAIFQAQANQLAWEFEDPKASLDYSLTRLEESRGQINRSLIEVDAAQNRLKDQRDKIALSIQKYQNQAEGAIKANREDLARTALTRKTEAESRQHELDENIATLEHQSGNLKESQANLERKISIFRSKKEELKAVYDSSRAQLRLREAVSGISVDLADVGNTIRRAEERIRELQSRSDAIEGLVAEGVLDDVLEPEVDDIDRQLSKINRNQAIEDELARLKAEASA